MNEFRRIEIYTGTFILSGIILVMGMILTMSGNLTVLREHYKLVVRINHIGDLAVGAPVKLGGVVIGKVAHVKLVESDIEVVAEIDSRRALPKDSIARIATSGLVGDTFLEIERGASGEMLPKSTTLAAAREHPLRGIGQPGTAELLQQVQKIGGEVEVLVDNLNKIIGDEAVQVDIKDSFANVKVATLEAKKLLTRLHASAVEVDKAVANVVQISSRVNNITTDLEQFVGKTVGDEKQVQAINETIQNVRGITASLNEKTEEIGAILANVKTASAKIAEVSGEIDPKNGPLTLLSDEELTARLKQTIEDLNHMARNLATVGASDLLADMKMSEVIQDRWMREYERMHRGASSEEVLEAWKRFRQRQEAFNDRLRQTRPTAVPLR